MNLPVPCSSRYLVTLAMASSAGTPLKGPELTMTPRCSFASDHVAGSPGASPSGRMTSRIGMPNLRANSKSRWSCAGTPMIYIGVDFSFVFGRGDLLDPRVFGGQHEEGGAIDRVRAGGKDGNFFTLASDFSEETDLRPFAAPDPVALHGDGLFGPLDAREVQQLFGIV